MQDVKPDGTDATSIKIIILVCTMTVTLLIPKITQTVSEMPTIDLEFTGVCIMVFYYTGQIVTFLDWIIILVDLILGFIDGLLDLKRGTGFRLGTKKMRRPF